MNCLRKFILLIILDHRQRTSFHVIFGHFLHFPFGQLDFSNLNQQDTLLP